VWQIEEINVRGEKYSNIIQSGVRVEHEFK